MTWYKIYRDNNKITIYNKNITPIFASLHYQEKCGDDWREIVSNKCINNKEIITLPGMSGIYRLSLSGVVDGKSECDKIEFTKFEDMLDFLIDSVTDSLCAGNCSGCSECDDDCEECDKKEADNKALLLLINNFIINHENFTPYLTAAFSCIKCEFLNINKCELIHNQLYGNFNNEKLLNYTISYMYLAIYYFYLNNSSNKEEIKERFNYNKLVNCISQKGIDTDCIKEKLKDMAKLVIINEEKVYTFNDCISVSNAGNLRDSIESGTAFTGESHLSLHIVNGCNKAFTISGDQTELFDYNGFKGYIDNVTIPANGSKDVPLKYKGTFTSNESNVRLGLNFGTGGKSAGTLNIAVTQPVVDQPPVAVDKEIRLENRVNTSINKNNLQYSDPNSDPITKVKFEGNVNGLYTNSAMTTSYVAGTELPISFTLYFKASDIDSLSRHEYTYKVYANGKWSR